MIDVDGLRPTIEGRVGEPAVRDCSGLAGIAFGVALVAGLLVPPSEPDYDAPLEEWVDWATDATNGLRSLLSVYLLVVAAILFVAFATGLARRVRGADGQRTVTSDWIQGLGLLAAAQLAVGGVAANTGPILYMLDGGEVGSVPDPTDSQLLVQIGSIGYLLIWVGMALTVAALIAVATVSLRDSMPAAFTVFSFGSAAILLGSITFVPFVLAPIWTLVAGAALMRRPTLPNLTGDALGPERSGDSTTG